MLIIESRARECCQPEDFEPVGKIKDSGTHRHVRCKFCRVEWAFVPGGTILANTRNGISLGYRRLSEVQVELDAEVYEKYNRTDWSSWTLKAWALYLGNSPLKQIYEDHYPGYKYIE